MHPLLKEFNNLDTIKPTWFYNKMPEQLVWIRCDFCGKKMATLKIEGVANSKCVSAPENEEWVCSIPKQRVDLSAICTWLYYDESKYKEHLRYVQQMYELR